LIGLAAGFLSDLLDGMIARRSNTVTAKLREMDGRTDVWFMVWIAASAWRTRPEIVIAYQAPLLLVLGTQILSWIIDLLKYRRFSNYHAYSAKAWGATIFATTLMWFGSGPVEIFLWSVVVFGMICTLEEIAITLTLPNWRHDVNSLFHALRLREEQSTGQ
jgi:CDP-diacylglycerol--glycerol-3-phosphate 3-phosphatidyltransferase